MRTDANVANGDPALPSATQLVQLLQTACPIIWDQLLPRRLAALEVTDPADLTPSKLAELRDYVFGAAKQAGINNPIGWIANRAQPDATAAAAAKPQVARPVEVGAAALPGTPLERELVLENSPAKASVASAPRVGARVLFGSTKAEVLSRAKAAIEAGEDRRITAARLLYAQEHFHPTQREMGLAVGLSASSVNRLLKWRRSGCKESSPFGPTTRAGRSAHRNGSNKNAGAEQSKDDENKVCRVGDCSPADQPASPGPSVNDRGPDELTQTHLLPGAEAVTARCCGPQAPLENGSRHPNKQKVPARNAKLSQKLSRQRMQIIVDSLRKCPILDRAAAKAGIHRKTLRYWWKGSEAGDDGYEIEWEGCQWRFHEACEAAIEEAYQILLDEMCEFALGPMTCKIDQHLVSLGYEGVDAYARDANGDFIVERRGPANPKIQEVLLAWLRPEKWGRPRKRKGSILVLGDPTRTQREKGCAASTKVRQWKAASRMIREAKGA